MLLYICSRETDYLQDLTYAGLCDAVGKEKIWDVPAHWQYRREKEFFWSRKIEYPRNLGFSASQAGEALKKNKVELVILASAKPDALESFHGLFERIHCPWVFIDGGDREDLGGDFKRAGGDASFRLFQDLCGKRKPGLIFKRELSIGFHDPSIFPFPFSFKKPLAPDFPDGNRKKFDVLFWAVESSETRKKAFRMLQGRYDCESNGSVSGQKFRKFRRRGAGYFEALGAAKINLSFRGEGFDTLRYWEIPACGSMMISEKPTIQIPNDFKDGAQAVFCRNDLSDLLEKIDYYLGHEKEREEIARAGRVHLLANHTHLHRARYFLDAVESCLKIRLKV